MAAKGEQIPAPSPIPAPSDAPDPAPDIPQDGATFGDGESTPIESAAAAAVAVGRAAASEVFQGGDPQGDSPSSVVPRLEDGGAEDEENATEEREEKDEEADDGEQGGGGGRDGSGGCGGGGGGKRGERKGALFLPDAKRRKACPAALEKLPTLPTADELATGGGRTGGCGGGREGAPGRGEPSPSSFSFSFDTRGFSAPPIETTPKFGSFNFAAIASAGSGAEPLAAAAGGGDEASGQQDAEGGRTVAWGASGRAEL